MKAETQTAFGDLAQWQSMLDRHADTFSEMAPGSMIGFVPRAGSNILPGKHLAALKGARGEGEMMTWEALPQGMRAGQRHYTGFEAAGVDLLFVADDEALATMGHSIGDDALSIIKRLIRAGRIMFYVMKTKYELQDAGYEEFLDTLGLAFLGACR